MPAPLTAEEFVRIREATDMTREDGLIARLLATIEADRALVVAAIAWQGAFDELTATGSDENPETLRELRRAFLAEQGGLLMAARDWGRP
jgi:hypothetical protein